MKLRPREICIFIHDSKCLQTYLPCYKIYLFKLLTDVSYDLSASILFRARISCSSFKAKNELSEFRISEVKEWGFLYRLKLMGVRRGKFWNLELKIIYKWNIYCGCTFWPFLVISHSKRVQSSKDFLRTSDPIQRLIINVNLMVQPNIEYNLGSYSWLICKLKNHLISQFGKKSRGKLSKYD